jgi:hypothetical protein
MSKSRRLTSDRLETNEASEPVKKLSVFLWTQKVYYRVYKSPLSIGLGLSGTVVKTFIVVIFD